MIRDTWFRRNVRSENSVFIFNNKENNVRDPKQPKRRGYPIPIMTKAQAEQKYGHLYPIEEYAMVLISDDA